VILSPKRFTSQASDHALPALAAEDEHGSESCLVLFVFIRMHP